MKHRRHAMVSLTCAVVAAAGSAPRSASADAGPLYDVLPDSTVLVIHVDQPARAMPRGLVDLILQKTLPRPPDSQRVWKTLSHLPGPLIIGTTQDGPGPSKDVPFHTFVVAELGKPPVDADKYVQEELLPLLNDVTAKPAKESSSKWTFDRSAEIRTLVHGEEIAFAYVTKDCRVFGSTNRTHVRDWLHAEFPKRKWAADGRVRNWLGAMPKAPRLRVLFNPAPLLKQLPQFKGNSPESLLLKLLSPADVRGVSGELAWDRDSVSLDLTIALADTTGGLGRALLAAPTTSRTLGQFPDDFSVAGRIAWPSASGLIDGAYAALDRVDPDISREYREDLVEFKNETGVDFAADVLGNLVGEVGFGGRVDFSQPGPFAWAAVCPLADAPRFAKAFDALVRHYDCPVTTISGDGIDVRRTTVGIPVCYTIADSRLMIGDSPTTLADLHHRAARAGDAAPPRKTLADCVARLFPANTACLMADARAIGDGLGPMTKMMGPAASMLTGTVGLALTREPNHARLRLIWIVPTSGRAKKKNTASPPADRGGATTAAADDDSAPFAVVSQLFGTVAESVDRARESARRTVSQANMRGVGQGLYIYAQDHKGQFPPNLGVLVKMNAVTLDMLTGPYGDIGPANIDEIKAKSIYVYRPGLSDKSDPTEILMAERSVRLEEGASFLFVDGHVEFIKEPKASELIEKIQSRADSAKP